MRAGAYACRRVALLDFVKLNRFDNPSDIGHNVGMN